MGVPQHMSSVRIAIQMQRKTSHGLCQDTHTGIHGGHLHGGALRHCFAGGGSTEQETVGATSSDIAGLVSRLEYSR